MSDLIKTLFKAILAMIMIIVSSGLLFILTLFALIIGTIFLGFAFHIAASLFSIIIFGILLGGAIALGFCAVKGIIRMSGDEKKPGPPTN